MAGDWLKIRNDLDDDPHVLHMAELLGDVDVDLIIGKLRRLWKHGDRHTTDGFIPFASAKTVDNLVALSGFAQAAEAVGWLEFTDGGAQIPRFLEHNGKSCKTRALAAARVAACKARKRKGNARALPREEKNREEKKGGNPPLTPPAGEPEIPACLDTPEFRAAWSEWLSYRRDRRL